MPQEKVPATGRITPVTNEIFTGGFFPMKVRIFLVTGNFISCDRNKKQHLVPQYIFPVNERIFLVTGNKFPVTGRTKNTSCHMKNISG